MLSFNPTCTQAGLEHVEHASAAQPKTLTCTYCSRRFTRPSHLNRHRQTHIAPNLRPTLPCQQCGRTFSRNDVLLRHLRVAHQMGLATKHSAQRSCFRCVRKKLKCNRARPCYSCSAAHASCSYPSRRSTPEGDVEGTLEASGTAKPAERPEKYFGTMEDRSSTSEGSSVSAPGGGEDHLSNTPPGPTSMMACPLPLTNTDEDLGPLLPDVNGYDSLLSEDGSFFAADNAAFASSLSPTSLVDFRVSTLDWLDFDMPDLAITGDSSLIPVGESPTQPSSTPLPALEPQQVVQPWPFDQTRDPMQHRYLLPPLHHVLQGALRSDTGARTGLPDGLLQLLSEARLPQGELIDVNLSPAFNLLKRLLDVYFAKFHTIQPVTHVPTWTVASCPTVLLAAMACIGAMLSDEQHAADLSWSLSELCIPMITWLGASDSANYRDISYLNSLCLHQIYSLGSGSRQLYQNADRSRGALIGSLRGMGLLSSRLSIISGVQKSDLPASAEPSAIHQEWIAWANRERERRTTWASFEYDCSLCTLTSRRGAVDLSELPRNLPCSESLWEAPSGDAWVALRSRLGPNALGAPLSSVFAAALAGKRAPQHVSSWGMRLCAQVIGRLLWDLKQLELIPMSESFGLSQLFAVQQQPKASLLHALDNLLQSMDQPTSTADLISYNIASLICHYSHLYTAQDAMDITLFIVRNVVSEDSSHDRSVETAQRQLQSTFARDPREARELVWHAAQIVAVANEYLVSAPCEILRLFMGYIFMIAFAKYFPRNLKHAGRQSPLRLDLPVHQASQKRAAAEWIEHGGPAIIGSAVDICSDGSALAISQDAQSMLQRLRCWGLAEKFIRILQRFESVDLSVAFRTD